MSMAWCSPNLVVVCVVPELIVLNASNRIAVESYIRAPSRTLLVALLLVGPGAFADLDEVREPESDFVRPWLSLDANVLP